MIHCVALWFAVWYCGCRLISFTRRSQTVRLWIQRLRAAILAHVHFLTNFGRNGAFNGLIMPPCCGVRHVAQSLADNSELPTAQFVERPTFSGNLNSAHDRECDRIQSVRYIKLWSGGSNSRTGVNGSKTDSIASQAELKNPVRISNLLKDFASTAKPSPLIDNNCIFQYAALP